jgi:hypothetical protein
MSSQMTTPPPGDAMRFSFVEMLFALAIGQVAVQAADLVIATKPVSAVSALPALTHLLLALAVISTSWVGWRHSQAPGAQEPIESIFSLRFGILLVDLLLVILYFILVKRVEIGQEVGTPVLRPPTGTHEAYWLSVIFLVYLFWDVVTDVFSVKSLQMLRDRRWVDYLLVAAVAGAASFVCLWLCRVAVGVGEFATRDLSVVLVDVGLLALVILFRVLKTIEGPLSRALKVEWHSAFVRRGAMSRIDTVLIGLMVMIYLTALLGANSLG